MKAALLSLFTFLSIGFVRPLMAIEPERPRLVVGIVVDQMRPDYLVRYSERFSKGGFNRLLNEGLYCRQTFFNYMPTYTGPGHASIYTGTTPAVHGIIANDWYDLLLRKKFYCSDDSSVIAIGTDGNEGKKSPALLKCGTITESNALYFKGKSKVLGVSLKDRGAILPAGRVNSQAFWFDAASGNWISSSFYMKSLPEWMVKYNAKKSPEAYLSKPWNTLYPVNTYKSSDPDNSPYEVAISKTNGPVFPYDLPALRGKDYKLIRNTPFGNTITTEAALAGLIGEKLGQDETTDFLCISYSSTDYIGHAFGTNAIETEDTYLRLDQELSHLLSELDRVVGKGKYLVFLTSDHGAAMNPQAAFDAGMNAGFYDEKATEDSLRNYLTRQLGSDQYLLHVENEQLYLDQTEIIKRKLNFDSLQNEIAGYLLRNFTAIADVVVERELRGEAMSRPFLSEMQNGYDRVRSGQIWIRLSPGYTGRLYGNGMQGTTHGSPYTYDTHVPLIWSGWGIKPGIWEERVEITDIAPTLSKLLSIPLPDSATGRAIRGVERDKTNP